jgi:hypothetical protein
MQRQEQTPTNRAGARPISQRRLRTLLQSSDLVPEPMRRHWLRVLPHLSEAQRAALAELLAPPTPAATTGMAEAGDGSPPDKHASGP